MILEKQKIKSKKKVDKGVMTYDLWVGGDV